MIHIHIYIIFLHFFFYRCRALASQTACFPLQLCPSPHCFPFFKILVNTYPQCHWCDLILKDLPTRLFQQDHSCANMSGSVYLLYWIFWCVPTFHKSTSRGVLSFSVRQVRLHWLLSNPFWHQNARVHGVCEMSSPSLPSGNCSLIEMQVKLRKKDCYSSSSWGNPSSRCLLNMKYEESNSPNLEFLQLVWIESRRHWRQSGPVRRFN